MNQGEQMHAELMARMRERILVLDGAMGTMIQARGLKRPITAARSSRATGAICA